MLSQVDQFPVYLATLVATCTQLIEYVCIDNYMFDLQIEITKRRTEHTHRYLYILPTNHHEHARMISLSKQSRIGPAQFPDLWVMNAEVKVSISVFEESNPGSIPGCMWQGVYDRVCEHRGVTWCDVVCFHAPAVPLCKCLCRHKRLPCLCWIMEGLRRRLFARHEPLLSGHELPNTRTCSNHRLVGLFS